MSRRALFVVVALVGAASFGAGRALAPSPAAAPLALTSPTPGAARPTRDTERRLDELQRDIEALWQVQEETAEAATPEIGPSQADPDAPEQAYTPEELTLHLHDTYEDRIASEPLDPAWGPRASAEVRASLDTLGPAIASIERLECRSSLCVVEFHYDASERDPQALADALGQLAPWPNQATSNLSTSGDGRGWLYLSREGLPLPG